MKRKNEGFSLIELIIVIAVMVILIALLVPNVIGYIRKAQITAMNANAKTIHNAVSAAMANLASSGVTLNTGSSPKSAKTSNMYIAASDKNNGGKIQVVFRMNGNLVVVNNTSFGLTDKADLVSYLGEGFDGNVIAYINPTTYSVDCVVYAKMTSPAVGVQAGWLSANLHPDLRQADSHIENDTNGNLVNKITSEAQYEDAVDGYNYGVYPQGSDSDS